MNENVHRSLRAAHFLLLKSPLLSHTVGNRVKSYCVRMLQSPSLSLFVFYSTLGSCQYFFFPIAALHQAGKLARSEVGTARMFV